MLCVGMVSPGDNGKHVSMVYRPQLFDMGKIDALSAPWSRIGVPPGPASARDRKSMGLYSKLLEAYALHHGKAALDKLGIKPEMGHCMVRSLSLSEFPGQIGVSLAAQIYNPPEKSESDPLVMDAMASPQELGSAWGKIVLGRLLAPLRSAQSCREWTEAPEDLELAVLLRSMGFVVPPKDLEAMSLWPSMLMALEEAIELRLVTPKKTSLKKVVPALPKRRL